MGARISSKTQTGNVTEAAVALVLGWHDFDVYAPLLSGGRCDLVIHDGERYRSVQCKTGWLRKGAVVFRTASSDRTTYNPRPYRGEVDDFGVYCGDNRMVYLVPVNDVPESAASLRVEPPLNNQVQGVRWARDYEIGPAPEPVILVDPASVAVNGDIWSFPADGQGDRRELE